jgi:hypothetical protein
MFDRSDRDLHHDLLNHIAVMSTFAELLTFTELDDEQAEMVSDIIDAGAAANSTVREMGASTVEDDKAGDAA